MHNSLTLPNLSVPISIAFDPKTSTCRSLYPRVDIPNTAELIKTVIKSIDNQTFFDMLKIARERLKTPMLNINK